MDQPDEVVRRLSGREDLRMLNQVNPGQNREPQPFDSSGMSFGHTPALMRLLHDDLLRLRREPDERGLREVARPAVFEKVRPLIQVLVDGDAQFLRRHIHQVFTAALGDGVIYLLLKERQISFGDQAETHRVRPAPSKDVPRSQNPRAHRFAARDCVPRLYERREHTVTVTNRRDPIFQLKLRGFEHYLVLARVISDKRFVTIPDAAIKGEMNIRINESG